jgi:hypothetical protein
MTQYKGKRRKAELLESAPADAIKESAKFYDGMNNTLHYKTRGGSAIQFHDTVIIRESDEGVFLYSGGWRTPTTKNRLNHYLVSRHYRDAWPRMHIYQHDGIWYLYNGKDHVFSEGMLISHDGKRVLRTDASEVNRMRDVRKKIKAYCAEVRRIWEDEERRAELFDSVHGDCLFCQCEVQNEAACDAIESHLDECYVMISLIYNALKSRGYVDPVFIMHYGSTDQIVRAVRVYLKDRMSIAR